MLLFEQIIRVVVPHGCVGCAEENGRLLRIPCHEGLAMCRHTATAVKRPAIAMKRVHIVTGIAEAAEQLPFLSDDVIRARRLKQTGVKSVYALVFDQAE